LLAAAENTGMLFLSMLSFNEEKKKAGRFFCMIGKSIKGVLPLGLGCFNMNLFRKIILAMKTLWAVSTVPSNKNLGRK